MRPSRQVIPAEIVVSLFALTYAWFGALPFPEPAPLFWLLYEREGLLGVIAWGLLLGGPAGGLAFFSGREWLCWKRCRWTMLELEFSARWRGRLVIAQAVSWAYATGLMLGHGKGLGLLLTHSAIGTMICLWSYLENRRVRREIRYATGVVSASR